MGITECACGVLAAQLTDQFTIILRAGGLLDDGPDDGPGGPSKLKADFLETIGLLGLLCDVDVRPEEEVVKAAKFAQDLSDAYFPLRKKLKACAGFEEG